MKPTTMNEVVGAIAAAVVLVLMIWAMHSHGKKDPRCTDYTVLNDSTIILCTQDTVTFKSK